MAGHYCDMIATFGKEYGQVRAKGIVLERENQAERDRDLAFEATDRMDCRA